MVTRWEVYLPGLLMQGQRLYSDSAAKRERLTSWLWVAPAVHSGRPNAIVQR